MNRYWFRPKKYGYGAFSSTWEGWALMLAFAFMLGGSGFVVSAIGGEMTAGKWFAWFGFIFAMSCCVVAISYWKTDGTWEWRGGKRGWFN